MSKLKLANALVLERMLLSIGFRRVRQRGSHVLYQHPDGRATTIPFHTGKDLPRPLIRTILSEINMTVDEYNALI